jgi:formylmethanofuran dehydrogenase subunit B
MYKLKRGSNMERVTCTGCSLLCNDIIIRTDGLFIDEVVGTCLKGKEHFDQITAKNRVLHPLVRKQDKLEKASWDEAYEKVLDLLKSAKKPLLYGFSTSSCEAQLKGMELAKELNGFISSNATICQGRVLEASKEKGLTLTSITEVINKADLIISWGANVAESIPRLLNKTLFSRGKFRMTGREIKTFVIIDPVQTASFGVMGVRDLALKIEPNKDIELIRLLKEECCKAGSIPPEGIAGIDNDDLKRLLLHLTGAEYGVILVGQGLLTPHKDFDLIKEFLELIELIQSKQEKGRISLVLLGGHYNMAGFDHVSLANFGMNGSLQFKNNERVDTEENLVSKIKSEDFDLSIFVGTDPISHLPHNLSKKILKHPIIVIDNKRSATVDIADLVLPSSITGIENSGLAIRLDQVPIQVQKIINSPNKIPSDEEILANLLQKLPHDGEK